MEYGFENEAEGEEDDIELATVDFEDAFHTLMLKEQDRGVMAFRTLSGWAVFSRLCCGMAGAPMVWCRTGAAGCRIAQACVTPRELRLQCFVDDPALAFRGTARQRSWLLGCTLLLWVVLGFRFNWSKGHRGQEVPWIGAQIAIQRTSMFMFYLPNKLRGETVLGKGAQTRVCSRGRGPLRTVRDGAFWFPVSVFLFTVVCHKTKRG
jgi:hypothetical protein